MYYMEKRNKEIPLASSNEWTHKSLRPITEFAKASRSRKHQERERECGTTFSLRL